MSSGNALAGLVRQVRARDGGEAADGELLERYVRTGDGDAFAALVQRYGSLVLGVARRQLAGPQAEDVFQATFLALARAAGRLGSRPVLTNWLYTVALRQARKARARASRRESVERALPALGTGTDPLDEITGRELLRVIDEELGRLPERFRLPVLLCCVQGLSRAEAAARLGWSSGTVKGRLERGRRRLAERLTARGLAPSALVLAPLAAVMVPTDLQARAIALAATPWAKSVPPALTTLVGNGPTRALLPIVALVGCVLAIGLIGWVYAAGGIQPVEPAAPHAVVAAPSTAAAEAEDDPLPEGSEARFGTTRFRHGTTIQNLSVSADGKLAVAGSGTRRFGSVRTYDLTTGRPMISFDDQQESYVVAVTLSADGKTVAIKRGDHTIHFFDASTGQETAKIPYPSANPSTETEWLTFSPDGKRILVGSADGKGVHLIDRDKLGVVRTFAHDNVVFSTAFSPDGKQIVAGGYDRDKNGYFARLWETETGKELRRFAYGNGAIRSVAYSPNGATIAIGGEWYGSGPHTVKLFDAATGKEQWKLPFPKTAYSVRSLAFAPDSKTLAAAGYQATRLFDTTTGAEKLKIDRKAIGLHFAPDGSSIVGAVSGTIYSWDAKTGKVLTPESADGVIGQIEVSSDGKRLVTRGQDGDAHVWDAHTGEHLKRVTVTWQRGLALSPDGRFLVWPVADETIKYKNPAQPNSIYTGNRLQLLDLTTGKLIERFGGFEGDAHDLFFTDGGKSLVTVDHTDGTVRSWDVTTGKVGRSFRALREGEKGMSNHVWHAQLSPDGKMLAVTYQPLGRGFFSPFAVRLWDMTTGKERHDLVGHRYYVEAMAFSADGKYLVTGSDALSDFAQKQLKEPPDQVFVWDVETGKAIARLPIGGTAGAFVADGKTLAVATQAGAIQLWDTSTWKIKGEFRGHRDRITALASGPGARLFSGGVDTTVLAWDTRTAKAPAKEPPADRE
jgi:RNA polymerase sigma factor (sigma-70 family)